MEKTLIEKILYDIYNNNVKEEEIRNYLTGYYNDNIPLWEKISGIYGHCSHALWMEINMRIHQIFYKHECPDTSKELYVYTNIYHVHELLFQQHKNVVLRKGDISVVPNSNIKLIFYIPKCINLSKLNLSFSSIEESTHLTKYISEEIPNRRIHVYDSNVFICIYRYDEYYENFLKNSAYDRVNIFKDGSHITQIQRNFINGYIDYIIRRNKRRNTNNKEKMDNITYYDSISDVSKTILPQDHYNIIYNKHNLHSMLNIMLNCDFTLNTKCEKIDEDNNYHKYSDDIFYCNRVTIIGKTLIYNMPKQHKTRDLLLIYNLFKNSKLNLKVLHLK